MGLHPDLYPLISLIISLISPYFIIRLNSSHNEFQSSHAFDSRTGIKKKPTKQNPQQSKQNQTNAMILKNVLQGEIQCLWRNNIQEMDMLQNDQ